MYEGEYKYYYYFYISFNLLYDYCGDVQVNKNPTQRIIKGAPQVQGDPGSGPSALALHRHWSSIEAHLRHALFVKVHLAPYALKQLGLPFGFQAFIIKFL